MNRFSLNGQWQLQTELINIPVQVPGSVYHDLLTAGIVEDPFYRDNEEHAKQTMNQDYSYSLSFELSETIYEADQLILVCEGLDTLAAITVNGQLAATTDNMHRTYRIDMKPFAVAGTNTISITFHNSLAYIASKQNSSSLWGVDSTVDGFPHIRKAHHSYGWDWGPQIPDAGIWRDIYLESYTNGKLDDVYMTQQHNDGSVELTIRVDHSIWNGRSDSIIMATLTTPTGESLSVTQAAEEQRQSIQIMIDEPQLWWPNGYGSQPLYQVEIQLIQDTRLLDRKSYSIGLRTLRVKQEPDQWGTSFEFEVNGISIFAMGANYIPEDNLLPRVDAKKTEQLIQDCVEAHFNCIRVWGGGIYADSAFYDLCDRYGLIVWQDFMFACAVYELTNEFADNIKQEAIDNIKRLRHHASLGIWCGNNEMEVAWVDWTFPKTEKLKADYIQQFEHLLADTVAEYDPNNFYWASSPSSGGSFDNPNDQNRGDVHYWEVWHALKPFTEYRKFHFRFCSEFGFQSFPHMKTIESFTLPEDRNIFSYVMERHQKNDGANGKIMFYLSQNFKYPKGLPELVYASQLLQAEAIKYGVEHWRRHRGRCMGSIYWQLNDCWPVASWSSVDYYGRWKALHYFAKRFYAPVLISACEEGTKVELHLSNESFDPLEGVVKWRLRDTQSNLLVEGSAHAEVGSLSTSCITHLDFTEELDGDRIRSVYLEYGFEQDGVVVSDGVLLFTPIKHFKLNDPILTAEWRDGGDHWLLELQADELVKYVELELGQWDGRWSDNYFDLSPGAVRNVTLLKSSVNGASLEELEQSLSIRHALHIAD